MAVTDNITLKEQQEVSHYDNNCWFYYFNLAIEYTEEWR